MQGPPQEQHQRLTPLHDVIGLHRRDAMPGIIIIQDSCWKQLRVVDRNHCSDPVTPSLQQVETSDAMPECHDGTRSFFQTSTFPQAAVMWPKLPHLFARKDQLKPLRLHKQAAINGHG